MIPLQEAIEIVLSKTPVLDSEEVALQEALGRILAEEVLSEEELPPFDRAAMDGYAVIAQDVAQAPVTLEVVGQVRAGQMPTRRLERGQAVQIMTGAPVPPGADAVEQVENTRMIEEGRRVEMLASVPLGRHIAPRGCEVAAGTLVLQSGRVLDPASIAVLAAVGKPQVRVGRRPRLRVLVTGDEIVEIGERPGPGCIRNSNGPTLVALARLAGAEGASLGVVPDDAERIVEAIRQADSPDVLVVSGGVSAGAFDLVEPAFARLGVEVFFESVAIKPGKPVVFGRRGSTLVFGLPGNPVSVQVTFDLLVRAALLRMQGARAVHRPEVEVELGEGMRNQSGRQAYAPARVASEAGRLLAWPVRSMGSADMVAHARANALVILPAQRTTAAAGERAPALLLGGYLDP